MWKVFDYKDEILSIESCVFELELMSERDQIPYGKKKQNCYIDCRTFNKIREIWGCILEALMKKLHLFIPQFLGYDETLIIILRINTINAKRFLSTVGL